MVDLTETVTRTRSRWMWAGSERDFRTLLKMMEQQFSPLVDDLVAEATAHRQERVDYTRERLANAKQRSVDSPDDVYQRERLDQAIEDLADAEQELKVREREISERLRLSGTVRWGKDDRRDVAGSAEQIADYVSGRRARSIEISTPISGATSHRITLSGDRFDGISLYVSSDDRTWASAAFSQLSEEIDRHVPPWRFFRTLWFGLPFFWLVGGFSLYWILDGIGDAIGDPTVSTIITVLYAVSVVFGMSGLALLVWANVWAFEITSGDRRPRGLAALLAVGGVLVSLIGGILVEVLVP